MKLKNVIGTLLVAILGGIVAVLAYNKIVPKEKRVITTTVKQPVNFAKMPPGDMGANDFVYAANKTIEAVVHVKTKSIKESYNPILDFFYNNGTTQQEILGFGSGVIISDDGYIVTNNHVVEGSSKVSVTLNDRREFDAEIIGTDPSTDLALLKIMTKDIKFDYVDWGNSDELQVGEWVLAVGNPFNLTSTVTAGIVSAKGKNLDIIQDKYRIESFIQTDAAVNRGNSGGALVDVSGKLVGINTAILSPTGGYAGISFAVPVSIVQKVVRDLIEYGAVQRAILGVSIADVTAELAKEKKLDKIEGVYIHDVSPEGAAAAVGIKAGDVILAINDVAVNSAGEVQEQISRYRPKDKVNVLIKRNGKTKQYVVVLRNLQGNTNYVKANNYDDVLGAQLTEITSNEKNKLKIEGGVKVEKLKNGKLSAAGVNEGFIITKINNRRVKTITELYQTLEDIQGGVYLEGVYSNGAVAYYAFGLN